MDGRIGDTGTKKYWYVTDHVGSIRAVTDKDGKKVWSADYLAFGKQFGEENNADYPDFEELHSFTGKEYDPDTGLHYYRMTDWDIVKFDWLRLENYFWIIVAFPLNFGGD